MQQYMFTDREIEEYLDGTFSGDVQAMESYLHGTVEGSQRLAYHKALYALLQSGPEPQLNISLPSAVMQALANRKVKKVRERNYVLWTAGGIVAVALLYYVIVLLASFSWSLPGINPVWVVVVLALMVIGFHGIDMREQQKRYRERNII
ncbi:MAG TPA: hypothetical protein VD996_03555 [Chitinophagaceae bacterium]|nr:hypothetical protein [Chitinophagaceae bacterium]